MGLQEWQSAAAPDWLNLDAATSPAIRERLSLAAEAVEALLPALNTACEEAYRAGLEYEGAVNATGAAPDDLWTLLDPLTGVDRLGRALDRVDALVSCAHRDPCIQKELWPAWYRHGGA